MRAALIVGVMLALAAGAVWLLSGGQPEVPVAGAPGDGAGDAGSPPAGSRVAAPPPPADAARAEPTTRTVEDFRVPGDLAPAPTAVLRIVDAETGAPLPGAAVYRLREADEAALAFADGDGLAPLPLSKSGQLMVAHRRHLLRMAPTRLGSTVEEPQEIALHPDRYSRHLALRFRLPDGTSPTEVFASFRPVREDDGDLPLPDSVRDAGEDVRRAWREQRTLAEVRAVPEVHVQLGFANAAAVHVLAADDEVAFVEPGRFELLAATTGGFAARRRFEVPSGIRLDVGLQPGFSIVGTVEDVLGVPLKDAYVGVRDGDPLRLLSRTPADGRFALWPLADGTYTLDVRHRDHVSAQTGPVAAGAEDLRITLQPLPRGTVRGRVLAAGTGEPIVGAAASLADGAEPRTVYSDRDGWFALERIGTGPVRLNVGADGRMGHSELVGDGADRLQIDLWPAAADERQRLGLSSMLTGIVVDASGAGIPGMGVRFRPDAPAVGELGRRVLQGGSASLPQATTTSGDGSFQLETGHPGGGTVTALDGSQGDHNSVRVTVVLGKPVTGLRITAARR